MLAESEEVSTVEAADICDVDLRKTLIEVKCIHLYQYHFFMIHFKTSLIFDCPKIHVLLYTSIPVWWKLFCKISKLSVISDTPRSYIIEPVKNLQTILHSFVMFKQTTVFFGTGIVGFDRSSCCDPSLAPANTKQVSIWDMNVW